MRQVGAERKSDCLQQMHVSNSGLSCQFNAPWYVFAENANVVRDMLIGLDPYRTNLVAEMEKMAASKLRWLGRADSVNKPVAATTSAI